MRICGASKVSILNLIWNPYASIPPALVFSSTCEIAPCMKCNARIWVHTYSQFLCHHEIVNIFVTSHHQTISILFILLLEYSSRVLALPKTVTIRSRKIPPIFSTHGKVMHAMYSLV